MFFYACEGWMIVTEANGNPRWIKRLESVHWEAATTTIWEGRFYD